MYALIAPVLTLCYQTSLSLPCKISASLCLTYLTTVSFDSLHLYQLTCKISVIPVAAHISPQSPLSTLPSLGN
ncbi:hypothetical protein EDB87DRAFT_934442 [Lactarius vividus]|nr:hypothetical protein EDB87DRAFT_934442 [Lactarius vividus]